VAGPEHVQCMLMLLGLYTSEFIADHTEKKVDMCEVPCLSFYPWSGLAYVQSFLGLGL
jgi:hypothetical protein